MNQSDNNDTANYKGTVPDILRIAADQLDVPTAGLAAVRRRGESRQQRRRVAVATSCAVLLFGAGVLTVQQLSATDDRTAIPGVVPTDATSIDATSTSATTATNVPSQDDFGVPVERVEPAFVWNAVVPGSAEAIGSLLFGIAPTDAAPYLAWSTAPGLDPQGNYVPTLYRSDDGIHWTPAPAGTFVEPEVSRRGLAVQGGSMFAFGTAAATAAIPKGGAGDAVVDVSTDGGTSWEHQVLPIDLRGLATSGGVGGVGLNGGMTAANGVVVVVAQPYVWWEAQQQRQVDGTGDLVITSKGAYSITYPTCGSERDAAIGGCVFSPTTLSYSAGGGVDNASATDDTSPIVSDLIPLSELGIDEQTVQVAREPRAFFSTDGSTFTEATFPPLPDEVIASGGADLRVVASGGQFYATLSINTFDPSPSPGFSASQLLYRSADGSTWEQIGDLNSFNGKELLGVLPNGTIIARSYTSEGLSGVSTSVDGVTWVLYDLRPLIDPSDGEIVVMDMWTTLVGNEGITAIGNVYNDVIAEEGGRSIEHNGVRLHVRSSIGWQLEISDVATGDEISQGNLSYLNNGGIQVLADDGSLVAEFTAEEMQYLQGSGQEGLRFTKVLLHSDDGVHWSRENVADLTGSNDAGPGFFQEVDGKVLINLIDPSQRTDGLATTLVLVGTRK